MHDTRVSPRPHLGMAAQQLREMATNLRVSTTSLRSRLTGAPSPAETVRAPLARRLDEGAEPSIAEQLSEAHAALHESHMVLEELHKELSRG